jgi:hexosaminidase
VDRSASAQSKQVPSLKLLNLLPYPRALQRRSGFFTLRKRAALHLESTLPRQELMIPLFLQLKAIAAGIDVELDLITGPAEHPLLAIRAVRCDAAPPHAEGYQLSIDSSGIVIDYRTEAGLRCGMATLRQLLRECGKRLPQLTIRDYPDFARRGVMLDVSRGRVPNLQTLLELVEQLADFKVNEFQLYTEHTFAYRSYEPVWSGWGPLTGEEILILDARCRQLGIDLVPNQNCFGHLRYWLEYPPLKQLAEVSQPYQGAGEFLRYPTTLAPNHHGTVPFLRQLMDELLPHFSSSRFNVGCDETWDLGRGQSEALCRRKGKGRVYVDFLKKIHREVTSRSRQMMFWGDIILHYPELIRELPKDVIALNWGYDADHPFAREARMFADSKLPFYVCPGTSTWMTLIGRHDNALANLEAAAQAGRQNGAIGYLNTDWGDGGHPQPLAVSYVPYLAGAAYGWCGVSFDARLLVPVLSRDVFHDATERMAKAAMALGVTHRELEYFAPNVTPLGTVIAAPPPQRRELVCRDGLKYYARISEKKIQATLAELGQHRALLDRAAPLTASGLVLLSELNLAARMAAQSCHIMLWQQALAAGKSSRATGMARTGIRQLRELNHDFSAYWPSRNKGTPKKCSAFLQWRLEDYRRGRLHFPPAAAAREVKVVANTE